MLMGHSVRAWNNIWILSGTQLTNGFQAFTYTDLIVHLRTCIAKLLSISYVFFLILYGLLNFSMQ